ncbi:hypothetical protein Tco_1507725 [Tanacetum coccineum]
MFSLRCVMATVYVGSLVFMLVRIFLFFKLLLGRFFNDLDHTSWNASRKRNKTGSRLLLLRGSWWVFGDIRIALAFKFAGVSLVVPVRQGFFRLASSLVFELWFLSFLHLSGVGSCFGVSSEILIPEVEERFVARLWDGGVFL